MCFLFSFLLQETKGVKNENFNRKNRRFFVVETKTPGAYANGAAPGGAKAYSQEKSG